MAEKGWELWVFFFFFFFIKKKKKKNVAEARGRLDRENRQDLLTGCGGWQ